MKCVNSFYLIIYEAIMYLLTLFIISNFINLLTANNANTTLKWHIDNFHDINRLMNKNYRNCDCNSNANKCNSDDGTCYCYTKGIVGKQCQNCDQPRYFGNANDGLCYYDLVVGYEFTFDLIKETDKYYKNINLATRPTNYNDLELNIICINGTNALFNLTYIDWYDTTASLILNKAGVSSNIIEQSNNISYIKSNQKQILSEIKCSSINFNYKFISKDHKNIEANSRNNKTDDNTNLPVTKRSFYIYLYNFVTPIKIKISFKQLIQNRFMDIIRLIKQSVFN